jgi:hypothetical protein
MRKYLLLFLGLLPPPIALGSLWWAIPNTGVSRWNFNRLNPGMSETEVRAILGEPVPDATMGWKQVTPGVTHRVLCWWNERYTIAVAFSWEGSVEEKCLVDELPLKLNPTLWDKFRLCLAM